MQLHKQLYRLQVQQDELNQVREEVRRAEGIIAEERVATEEYRKKEQVCCSCWLP